jgi:hypothetical protein
MPSFKKDLRWYSPCKNFSKAFSLFVFSYILSYLAEWLLVSGTQLEIILTCSGFVYFLELLCDLFIFIFVPLLMQLLFIAPKHHGIFYFEFILYTTIGLILQ